MDAQLSELPEGDVGSSTPASTTGTNSPAQAVEKQGTAKGNRDGQCLQEPFSIDSGRGLGESDTQQVRTQEQERDRGAKGEHSDQDEHGAQQGESRDDSDADCALAERACPRDASTRGSVSASKRRPKKQKESTSPQLELPVLSESQVTMLHEEISKRMFEIQDSLSTIKQKHPAVASIHPEKVQYSRPADLMEIYCEKDSQITQQINRCGGNALRFTKEDGDLNTEEGVNKLWTWVEMYEPKHIWVAPECRL